eukprot:jgi/Ulvmu1/12263/UM086_0056.1
MEDIQLWQTACVLHVKPRTHELVRILKVADVVGDTEAAHWVNELATHVNTTDWQQADATNTMLAALLQLPHHLLNAVLTACMTPEHPLTAVLGRLPLPLLPNLIAAATAAASGSLHLPDGDRNALHALLTATIPSPGLLAFTLSCLSMPTATAAVLARALAAHPALTSLDLLRSASRARRTAPVCRAAHAAHVCRVPLAWSAAGPPHAGNPPPGQLWRLRRPRRLPATPLGRHQARRPRLSRRSSWDCSVQPMAAWHQAVSSPAPLARLQELTFQEGPAESRAAAPFTGQDDSCFLTCCR